MTLDAVTQQCNVGINRNNWWARGCQTRGRNIIKHRRESWALTGVGPRYASDGNIDCYTGLRICITELSRINMPKLCLLHFILLIYSPRLWAAFAISKIWIKQTACCPNECDSNDSGNGLNSVYNWRGQNASNSLAILQSSELTMRWDALAAQR